MKSTLGRAARASAACLAILSAGCASPPGTYKLQVIQQPNSGPQVGQPKEYMLNTSTGTLYERGTFGWKRATLNDFEEHD